MKAKTLQILWHGKDPVLTLDFHHSGLLATGGADKDIRLWKLSRDDDGAPEAAFQSSLSHHNLPVNIVRFSPTGEHLASGGDGGELMLWKQVTTATGSTIWKVVAVLKSHLKDVADLCWSLDGASMVTASVDNSCIVWDVAKASARQFLEGHQHFVQGVAWDPLGHFIVSQSADRSCRVYAPQPQGKGKPGRRGDGFVLQHTLAKREAAGGAAAQVEQGEEPGPSKPVSTKHHMFQDESMPSFFRRLAWSPDGSFLITPAGLYKPTVDSRAVNTSYVFSRKDLSSPVMHLPGAGKSVVAVRFCPKFFKPLPKPAAADGAAASAAADLSSTFKLPYRLVYAVATLDSLFLYDTQRPTPIALLAGLHYAAISDLAWSADAQYLAVASQDGFCTVVAFDDGELGEELPLDQLPPHVAEHLPESCWSRAANGAEKERENAAAGTEEQTPSPGQQPAVAPAACHVAASGKRPAAEGVEAPPPKQARRITPVASAPAENTLDAATAHGVNAPQAPSVNTTSGNPPSGKAPSAGENGLGTSVNTLVGRPVVGEALKGPRRIVPVASAPVTQSALLGQVKNRETQPVPNPSLNPGGNLKRITPVSAAKRELAEASLLEPSLSSQVTKRDAKVFSTVDAGAEPKKRRIAPVLLNPVAVTARVDGEVRPNPASVKPKTVEPSLASTNPQSGAVEASKPPRRITPSPSARVEDAALTTPVKRSPSADVGKLSNDVSKLSNDLSRNYASPPPRVAPDAGKASPGADDVRTTKHVRRISPSPCKPAAGLEELARSASIEIARALSVEPIDGDKNQ